MPTGIWGAISKPGDADHFAFDAKAGETIVCELSAVNLGSKLNGVLTVFDARLSAGDLPGALQALSTEFVDDFAGVGDADVVRRKIADYREAGVTLPTADRLQALLRALVDVQALTPGREMSTP